MEEGIGYLIFPPNLSLIVVLPSVVCSFPAVTTLTSCQELYIVYMYIESTQPFHPLDLYLIRPNLIIGTVVLPNCPASCFPGPTLVVN